MIGKSTEEAIGRAMNHAAKLRHEYFTVEHIFHSLLDNPEVVDAIDACGGQVSSMRKDIEAHLEHDVPKAVNQGQPPAATLAVQRLIQRAVIQVQSAGKDEIQPIDLLVSIYQAKESWALHILTKYGVSRLDLLSYLSHGSKSLDRPAPRDIEESSPGAQQEGGGGQNKESSLTDFITNLNERAKQGKVDPLIGREKELDRMVQILCRRRKNNPLLVGEAGVGKTALAEGLALRIVNGDVPDLLNSCVIYSLDIGGLVAGTKFRGDFEGRVKALFGVLKKKPNAILFIDEIHSVVGAGAVAGGAMDGANLLKPLLTSGEIRVIGSTTYKEYRNIFEKDAALARRFQKVDVVEPSQDEAVQILKGLKTHFEDHHGVTYTSEALKTAVELSAKHITDRYLPDKAIDVIDEAGAMLRLAASKSGRSAKPRTVDKKIIEEMIAKIARVPTKSVSVSQKERLSNMERDLKMVIFGQDEAIDCVVSAIRLARSGLRSGEKPIGSFLFCGPTGVGKTELAKQLARSMGVPFLRFDMSEYMEKHTVSRLIGAPPGYVGFEQEGMLTEAAIKNPHSVILLDEIEKAHSDVWNILLQVMDYGTLTDNNGRKADFRNTVIIMTSNVGAREMDRTPLGLTVTDTATAAKPNKEVERVFTPEFRNRLDATVYFNALTQNTVHEVLGKLIVELETQLLAKNVDLEILTEAREWLAARGYDKRLGARPMARLLQDKVKKPLSAEILFGKLEHGGSVKISLKDDDLYFVYKPRPQAVATKGAKKKKVKVPVTEGNR
jgi:ATP-dependent Clp protease ATP-binding subunit ClpA